MANPEDNNNLEFTSLQWEAKSRQIDLREREQKLQARWVALVVGCLVLLFMAGILLYHLLCKSLLSETDEFSWTMVVTPIASITVITAALLIAAFRRYEDKDLDKIRDGASMGVDAAT